MKYFRPNFILLFVVFLAFTIPGAVSASSESLLFVSGTDTQCAGYSLIEPADPLNTALYSFGTWVPAATIVWTGSPAWYDPSQAPFGNGAAWISSAASREGADTDDQWRLFQKEFTLPEGATITSAQLAYTADNAVTVYLNGVEISSTGSVYGAAPVPGTYYFQSSFTTGFNPAAGSNTLQFVVRNWRNNGGNPTGLLYKGSIDYTVDDPVPPIPAPEFPALFLPVTMITGFLGAVLIIRKTTNS